MIWKLLDAPVGVGGSRPGCEHGPAALRKAGLLERLRRLGTPLIDGGTVQRAPLAPLVHPNGAIRALPEIAAWTRGLAAAACDAGRGTIFIGGDHSISAGTMSGMARRARSCGRPLFVLWIDAHPDFHTLETTTSGNLHGVPLAYASGRAGFAPYFPPLAATVDPRNICTLGTRSIDAAERSALVGSGVTVHDMATVRHLGAVSLVDAFLARVAAAQGWLHVSFDVDFLDPRFAPAIGTPVADGASLAETFRLMERLHDSGLVTSLDVVEFNPTLGAAGATAGLVVDLVSTLVSRGASAQDRPALEGRRAS